MLQKSTATQLINKSTNNKYSKVRQRLFQMVYRCRNLTYISNFRVSAPQWSWKIKSWASIVTPTKIISLVHHLGGGAQTITRYFRIFRKQRNSNGTRSSHASVAINSTVLLEKLPAPQLLKRSPAFYENWRFMPHSQQPTSEPDTSNPHSLTSRFLSFMFSWRDPASTSFPFVPHAPPIISSSLI